MKILIATDMEGITGVTTWDQVTPGHAEYARFRRLMTQDVNAAIRGAFEAGAQEVLVTDGHWNGSNILVEELEPRARLNTGSPSPFSMVQGIDESVDGVMFIGYHARNGSPNAVLDHTWSSKTYLLPTSWVRSLTIRVQVAAISCSLCQPRQMTTIPGSPSDLRPKKPPSWAIQRMT